MYSEVVFSTSFSRFSPSTSRLEFAAPVLRVIKSVLELIVHLQYPPVVLADRLEPLRLAHLRIEFQTRTDGRVWGYETFVGAD